MSFVVYKAGGREPFIEEFLVIEQEVEQWRQSLSLDDCPDHLPDCEGGECDCAFELWFLRCMHCGALSNPCLCEEEVDGKIS